MVGTPGSVSDRALLINARARSLPSLAYGAADASAAKPIGVCPAATEVIAGPLPPNGTWTRSRPSVMLNCSPNRCDGVPVPGEAKLYLPELDLMSATSSLTVFPGNDGLTASTDAKASASVMGSKSLYGSYGTRSNRVG